MAARRMRFAFAAVVALIAGVPPAAGGDGEAFHPQLTVGVVPQRAFDDAEGELMTEAGITSVRVWFSWAQVEARQGERDWSLLDDTVADNARAGMSTLPFLFGTLPWAAAEDAQECYGSGCVAFAP